MKKLVIISNTDKPDALRATRELVPWLEQMGHAVVLTPECAGLIGRSDLAGQDTQWAGAALAVVLGGDGTLLHAAKQVAPLGLPVLGINTGRLGFLTEVELAEMYPVLTAVLDGGYEVERRMMLDVRLLRAEREQQRFLALNDAVIAKGPVARTVRLTVAVGEMRVAGYAADGVVLATPTGSTAYSLSAGGPLVQPNLGAILITPICPHSFTARPLVVGPAERVRVSIDHAPGDTVLTVDGQWGHQLEDGDAVEVSRAQIAVGLVRRPGYTFFRVLRQKLAEPGPNTEWA